MVPLAVDLAHISIPLLCVIVCMVVFVGGAYLVSRG